MVEHHVANVRVVSSNLIARSRTIFHTQPDRVIGCASSQPDYSPFADGMKAIGISLVVVAIVGALADLIMAEGKRPKNQPEHKSRKPRSRKPKGGNP